MYIVLVVGVPRKEQVVIDIGIKLFVAPAGRNESQRHIYYCCYERVHFSLERFWRQIDVGVRSELIQTFWVAETLSTTSTVTHYLNPAINVIRKTYVLSL